MHVQTQISKTKLLVNTGWWVRVRDAMIHDLGLSIIIILLQNTFSNACKRKSRHNVNFFRQFVYVGDSTQNHAEFIVELFVAD